jgi:hypothetical protein
MDEQPAGYHLSFSSRIELGGQETKQLPLLDFHCHESAENDGLVSAVCKQLYRDTTLVFSSGESYHALGLDLLDEHGFRDFLNLISVRKLDRSSNGTAFDSHFQEHLDPSKNHLHQIFTFLFITGEAMDPDSLGQTLLEDAFEIPVEYLPNLILALDRYLITYCCDDGVCPNPMHARGVAIQATDHPADAFLRFYLLLGQALNVTRTASLPYWQYLAEHHQMPAKVLFSSVETPPPHLGRWTEGI